MSMRIPVAAGAGFHDRDATRGPASHRLRRAALLAVNAALFGCGAGDPASADGPWSTSPREEDRPLFTTDFPPEEFAARRDIVYDAIGPNAIAIVQGAAMPPGFIRFRQNNTFYYLSGIESPHAYLLLNGATRRTTVFLQHHDERRERSEGKVLSADDADLVVQLTGVDEVQPTSALVQHLAERPGAGAPRPVYTPFSPEEGLSGARGLARRAAAAAAADPFDGRPSRRDHFVSLLCERLPGVQVEDLSPIVDHMRLVKSPREIDLIRTSTRLQGLGIMEAMRSTQPGVTETELEAPSRYIFQQHGAQGDAYYALIHVGANAYMAHYHAGIRPARDGDMILMDYGPDYEYYTSDMARMWPANGRFNAVQRELYTFYLTFYEAILNRIRPGVTAQQIKQEALEEIDAYVAAATFSKPEYGRAVRDFVEAYRESASNPWTRLGHGVGMGVHDVGRNTGPLRPGMVFVIEPQFRVPEEKIYIRLEDTVVVTDEGVEVLSEFVPRDIPNIERLVREEGMLQRYPRLLDADGDFVDETLERVAAAATEG